MTTNLKTYLTTKSDKYHVIVSYYLNGERKQSWISTGLSVKGNNKRKAEEMRKKTEVEWRERLNLNNYSDILFCDYMLKWLENNISLKQNTYKNYEMVIKGVIYPYFHERKIKLIDLKKEDIQSFYKYKIEHDNVSPNTVRKYHSYIRQALQSAVSNERIAYDPSLDIKLPRKIEHKANYYDQIEFKQLLSAVKESKIEAVIMLAALFGLRRSEILGLRWSCIDFEKRTIPI